MVEGEIDGGQLGHPPGGASLRHAKVERTATRNRNADRGQLRVHQLAEQEQGGIRLVEMLGVVNHQDERLDQKPWEVREHLAGRRHRIDLLR